MDARPILITLARVFHEHGLEVIMIGNFDFVFRKTPVNLAKLRKIALSLGGVLFRAYYPASDFYRFMRDEDSLQLDFVATIHSVRSFEILRSRAERVEFDGHPLLVADLADVSETKKAGGSTKQLKKKTSRKEKLEALKLESDRALRHQIRRLLRQPPDKRTHFLRKRLGIQASCL